MRIAKIFVGSPTDRKGFFNNVLERIRHINYIYPGTETFLIRYYDDLFIKFLKFNFKNEPRVEFVSIEGITINCIWVKHTFIDHILTYTFRIKGIVCENLLYRYVKVFEKFDLLSPHGLPAIYLASLVKAKYGIPFFPTWHGSDINVGPLTNRRTKLITIQMLELANYNFFVSKKLLEQSLSLSKSNNKVHLYSGVSTLFFRYSDIEKKQVRKKLSIESKKVVTYVGNFNKTKNVLLLPKIFSYIQESIKDVTFCIAGDGILEKKFKEQVIKFNLSNVIFYGRVNSSFIADLLNVTDVFLLTSHSEGLPRVILEAINCGVSIVSSNVGGIQEVVSKENLFELNDMFCFNVAKRTTEILEQGGDLTMLNHEFNWNYTLNKEIEIYKKYILN